MMRSSVNFASGSFITKLWRSVVSAVAVVTLCATPAGADNLNGWQRTVVKIAKSLTEGFDSDRGFSVEYNSKFADLDYGSVLAPSRDGKTSSMNIITRCTYDRAQLVTTSGADLPSFAKSGSFSFGAKASIPADFFATKALRSAGANLNVSRKKDVSYDFQDLSVGQLTEAAALAAVNSPACLAQLGHRDRIFIVRGQLNMRLTMAQTRHGDFSLGAEVVTNTKDPERVGFDVSWSSKDDWVLNQKKPRPWFRVVGMMQRGPGGKFDFVRTGD